MPLKALRLKPGIFREATRYTGEGGWYECDKVRFRSGQPEKIGGWQQVNNDQFLGFARALWPWDVYLGLGTEVKYYVYYGAYYDITPIDTYALTNPFSAVDGSAVITVAHTSHGRLVGDYVQFDNVTGLGGNMTQAVLELEYQVTEVVNANSYRFNARDPSTGAPVLANATDQSPGSPGGGSVTAQYQPNIGTPIQYPPPGILTGWGGGTWGSGVWGGSLTPFVPTQINLWNAYNFGEDLIYGPKGGGVYYWDASAGFTARGTNIADDPGASDAPLAANYRMVSDASRIVLCFGTTPIGATSPSDLNPMLIRWSDQEDYLNWTPSATTQAGDLTLSRGSDIRAVAQTRQEILIWTDIALYSLQYLGPPIVWGSQILADNITIVSDRAWAVAAGVTYWMGDEKFYVFDGRVQTLNCDIRKFIFDDFNANQNLQVFASTVEQFSEVWWFYCSITGPDGTGTPANPNTVVDRYAVFNYAERIWYYGSLGRTAWLDASVLSNLPIAADYNRRLLNHETGCDDASTPEAAPIEAYITSSQFDIDDGHNFGFVRRMLPDVTFTGSTATVENQSITMALLPLQNSGSGYTRGVENVGPAANMSVALTNEATVQRDADNGIERFSGTVTPYDGNLYIRVRGRQMSLRVASTGLGVQWQLGTPRMDVRPSGRKS
jgi:hypothetical protein